MIAGMMGMFGIIWLVVMVFFLFLNWKIVSKAGCSHSPLPSTPAISNANSCVMAGVYRGVPAVQQA